MSETPVPARPAVPTPAALRPAVSSSASFGRVTDDGTVYLRMPDGEVVVGQWAAGPPAEGLAFFVRKYDDLIVEGQLARQRLLDGKAAPDSAELAVRKLREALEAHSFVGDVVALRALCDDLDTEISHAKERVQAQRAEMRARAAEQRQALVEEAEKLSTSRNWRPTTERYAAIVEEWKGLPHADRATEQALWKRLSAARTQFDKARRAHFTETEAQRKVAVARKRELIAQAEALSTSTDWVSTGRKLRDLMNDWKAAPRGSRHDEDRLWNRFKAAQDAFYAAKSAADAAADDQLRENVPAKEALVVEAEALLPIGDIGAAKRALRAVQDRWEKAGDLPRTDRERLERRLKRVEEAVRSAEADRWRRSNPEARARAESTATAFADSIARLEQQLAKAQAVGNAAEITRIEGAIAQTQLLLQAAQAAADEFAR